MPKVRALRKCVVNLHPINPGDIVEYILAKDGLSIIIGGLPWTLPEDGSRYWEYYDGISRNSLKEHCYEES